MRSLVSYRVASYRSSERTTPKLFSAAGFLAVAAVTSGAGLLLTISGSVLAAELVWEESDWSDHQYAVASGVDPDIEPGLLVLENRPDDIRFMNEVTAFEGIYCMASLHDTLFLGAGPAPFSTDGADIIAYDYFKDDYSIVYQLFEQGVSVMEVVGDTLLIPGADSQGSHDWGNIYLYDGSWTRKETVPGGTHIIDLIQTDGTLFATGADGALGVVWRSDDWGDTFEEVFRIEMQGQNYRRFYGAGVLADRIFFQPDGREPNGDWILSSDGTDWDTMAVAVIPEQHGQFTVWGDSLTLSVAESWYVFDGVSWHHSALPFQPGNTWCGGVGRYGDALYGGAGQGNLYRWRPETNWTFVTQLGLVPELEEIEAVQSHLGRLFVSTSRSYHLPGGRLYVSAALEYGDLESQPHDFGTTTHDGHLSWDAFSAGIVADVQFQFRSSLTLSGLSEAVYVGPDGTESSFYESSGATLHPSHDGDRYFQYRVVLRCPGGVRMPFLRRVRLEVETEDPVTVPGPDESLYRDRRLVLGLPHPNPSSTSVHFQVRRRASFGSRTPEFRLTVWDVLGREVFRETASNSHETGGTWRWALTDQDGDAAPSGMYLVRAESADTPRAITEVRSFRVVR